MNFSSDIRGVSEVLGGILVFALVLTVLVIVQVAGVPAANQQIEFEHNARVQGDFQEFDQSIEQMAATGAGNSVTIESGVRYPSRLFLINPGPAAGTVSSGDVSDVTFSNVRAVNDETADHFSGVVTYDDTTTSLSYAPTYNEYTSAPTTRYEHGILYNTDDSAGFSVFDRGNVISGNRISLTVLDGDISSSSTRSIAVPTKALSGPSQSVSVTGDGSGDDIEITIYSSLSVERWENHILANEPHVTGISCGSVPIAEPCNGPLTISLDPSETYTLRLAKVGIGSGYTEESASYVTTVEDLNVAVTSVGGTVTAEIRDRFNNPVPGETLYVYSPDGTFPNGDEVVSNERGRIAAKFIPGNNVQQATIFVGTTQTNDGKVDTSDETQYVEYGVSVTDAPESDDGQQINPTDGSLVLTKMEQDGGLSTVTFENKASSTLAITEVRIPFYYDTKPGNNDGPLSATISDGSESVDVSVRGPYVTVPTGFSVAAGGELELELQFYENITPASGEEYDQPNSDDFYVMSAIISGTSQNYFLAPGDTSDSSSTGNAELSSVSASDLTGTGSQTQTLSFTLSSDLAETETVSIDLTDTDRNGQNGISYSSQSVTSGGGTAVRSGRMVTYNPPSGGLSSGDTVELSITANPGNNADGNTYTAVFSRSDTTGTESITFNVN